MKMISALSRVTHIRNIAEHACISTGEDPFSHACTTRANPIERLFIAPYWVNYHAEHHLLCIRRAIGFLRRIGCWTKRV
jgi:hypothetical protein